LFKSNIPIIGRFVVKIKTRQICIMQYAAYNQNLNAKCQIKSKILLSKIFEENLGKQKYQTILINNSIINKIMKI